LRTEVEASISGPRDNGPPAEDGDSNARISLRLPESLKSQIEQAAGRDGVSVNTWLVRAASSAVADTSRRGGGFTVNTSSHRISGYING
jgi:uncharacterized protein (DUF1778 family)